MTAVELLATCGYLYVAAAAASVIALTADRDAHEELIVTAAILWPLTLVAAIAFALVLPIFLAMGLMVEPRGSRRGGG